RIEIGTDEALGGACLLDLRNQREAAGFQFGRNRALKSAGCGDIRGTSLDLIEGKPSFCSCDFFSLVGLDLAQDIRHSLPRLETSTSLSSAAVAAPLSMAFEARSTPSRKFSAVPAMTSAAAALRTEISR